MTGGSARRSPALISAVNLLEMDLPEPRWAIDELLPEGLVVLAGKPKCGKSWLVLQWAIQIAAGGSFGAFGATSGSVLYLALEDNRRRLRDRIKKLDAGVVPADLMLTTEWAGGVGGLRAYLTSNPRVRLVVIDTLARFDTGRSAKPGESAYAADYEKLAPLKKLADEFGVCILVVTHTRKAGSSDVFDTVTGTRGVTGAADAAMVLARASAGGVLNVTGRDVESREVHLTWESEFCRWWPAGDHGERPMSSERRKVVEAIRKAGQPLTPKQVAEATRATEGSIRKLLPTMLADGQLEKTGEHEYALPTG